jgi:hypothetical protein
MIQKLFIIEPDTPLQQKEIRLKINELFDDQNALRESIEKQLDEKVRVWLEANKKVLLEQKVGFHL